MLALTVIIVAFAGSAGTYALEQDAPGGGFDSHATALWWTAMILTTMGSEYWPKTGDGRMLCLFLALYAYAVFGYVTGTLATFFIGQDDRTGVQEELAALRAELRALRSDRR